jgi:predicted nucleic acid-binding protein
MTAPVAVVVDADVLRAAGGTEHPTSKRARQALEAIRAGEHRLVLSGPLLREYKNHESRFATLWRSNMVARKRLQHWDYVEDSALRNRLVDALPKDAVSQQREVLKDAHLLEAAVATGQRIVSMDAKAKALFQKACPKLQAHGCLLWGDLTEQPEGTIKWIEDGCRDDLARHLCPKKAPKHNR